MTEAALAFDLSFDLNNYRWLSSWEVVIEFYYHESLKEYIINIYREDMNHDISW